MRSRWLLVLGLVNMCVGLGGRLSQSMSVPTYWGVQAEPAPGPEREHSRVSAPQVASLQPQHIQPQSRPLSWKFPEAPVAQVKKLPAHFELQQPAMRHRVALRCGASHIQVEVSQDLLGLGRLVRPEEMLLGGCSATEVDDSAHVLIFQSELHECGSTFMMTKDAFVYAFSLVYNPKVLAKTPILRSLPAVIGLECHYPRKHSLSSAPTRESYKHDEEQPSFVLQLMTDNWKTERSSSRYIVGDIVNLQASVMGNVHVPLRLWVDNCVVSTKPDSEPLHAFIKNHGCLGNRHVPGSRFMPQSQPDELQFQVPIPEALHFQHLKTTHITCQLKAMPALSAITTEHKACYFHKQWRAVGGKDQVCVCCESTCGRDLYKGRQWQAEVTLGPLVITPKLYSVEQ